MEICNQIALFIPCYNEEKRLKIESIQKFINNNSNRVDFYFVDDGSIDRTGEILKELIKNSTNSFLIRNNLNLGKGYAIRNGVNSIEARKYSFIGFIDSDSEIPFNHIFKLHQALMESGKVMAITKRRLSYNFPGRLRSLTSILMVYIANNIIKSRPKILDTQCGCKLFRSEVSEIMFEKEFISGWLFDIEIFLRLRNEFHDISKLICEVPIHRLNQIEGKSTLKLLQNTKLFSELYRINKYYNSK